MASWASIAKAAPQPVVPVTELASSTDNLRVVVVDANAIINGIRLENVADRAVTIQEVLDEIRDKQSRQFLATLPFGIDVSEPSEESLVAGMQALCAFWSHVHFGGSLTCVEVLTAVTRFARETGDVHALSTVDLKVIALAHTLEVAAHGSGHLREHPGKVGFRSPGLHCMG